MKTFPSRDRLETPAVKGRERIDPKHTIATREFSKNGAVALVDLTVPQLAEAFRGLDQVQQHHERLTGICAVMKGLVLCEAKAKIGYGGFMTWVKENFPKSHKTANQYKRLAEEFGKLHPKVQFENLRSDLLATLERLEGFQLDLQHPLVREVVDWVNGRSAYQLLLELGPGTRGGDTSAFRKQLSHDEEHALLIGKCREESLVVFNGVADLARGDKWKINLSDGELEIAADEMRDFAKRIAAWLRVPQKHRTKLDAEQALLE